MIDKGSEEMNNEQWNDKGNCNICRRQNYCKKPCKACKERREYELKCFVAQKMFQSIAKKENIEQLKEKSK